MTSTSAPGLCGITSPSGYTPTAIGMIMRHAQATAENQFCRDARLRRAWNLRTYSTCIPNRRDHLYIWLDGAEFHSEMDTRIPIVLALTTSIAVPAVAQTQPTRPSAYPTIPTLPSAFATPALSPCFRSYRDFEVARSRRFSFGRSLEYLNPESPCYSGTIYPSYSAVTPSELPSGPRAKSEGSEGLNEDQALLRIGAKGYLDISGLEKDKRGIWRGKAILDDGRPVDVTLDLEGNIYSVPSSRLRIRIEPPPSNR